MRTQLRQSGVALAIAAYLLVAGGFAARVHDHFAHGAGGEHGGRTAECCEHDGAPESPDPQSPDSDDCPMCYQLTSGSRGWIDAPATVVFRCAPDGLVRPIPDARPLDPISFASIAPRAPPVA